MRMTKHFEAGGVVMAVALVAGLGWAQESPEPREGTVESEGSSDAKGATNGEAAKGEQATDGTSAGEPKELDPTEIDRSAVAEAASSPHEKPGETYLLAGVRYRGIIVPKFMMNLFGDGGATVYVDAVGPELGIRKDNFEFLLSAWYADYSMDPTPFKASSDPATAWELVESQMNVLYLTSDFIWTYPVSDEFGVNYGMGGGFGIVWGDLIREQAYRNAQGDFVSCGPAPGAHPWCGDDNDHYDGYTEPSWTDGGSKPVVFPWLAFQTGVRYKPHRNFAARLDLGFGITGFWFGLGADYGI